MTFSEFCFFFLHLSASECLGYGTVTWIHTLSDSSPGRTEHIAILPFSGSTSEATNFTQPCAKIYLSPPLLSLRVYLFRSVNPVIAAVTWVEMDYCSPYLDVFNFFPPPLLLLSSSRLSQRLTVSGFLHRVLGYIPVSEPPPDARGSTL